MPKRPDHHPPLPAPFAVPEGDHPEYLLSPSGVQGFGRRGFYVAAIPRALAVEVVLAKHYSHRIVNNSYVHLGVFMGGQLVGVLQLGYALNPSAMGKVVEGTGNTEYLELNRMWLDDIAPRNSESQALSYTIKYLRKACPEVAWIQSLADQRCGGWGVVYQAANFDYLGHHWTSFYELDGETYHEMLLTAHANGGNRGAYLRANIERAERRRLLQFRYIFFIKRGWRRRLRMSPLPPPKPGQPLPDRRRMRKAPWVRGKSAVAVPT